MRPFGLPSELMSQLTMLETSVLWDITDLCQRQAPKSRHGAEYCFPSQGYLAKKYGVCRATVNRIIKRLKAGGWITSKQRRKFAGRWQTCLYHIGNRMRRILKQFWEKFSLRVNRVTPELHIDKKPTLYSLSQETSGALRAPLVKNKGEPGRNAKYFIEKYGQGEAT
jgi:DNA-binding transcriptional MocR family regulator